jgi:hypothetical protein
MAQPRKFPQFPLAETLTGNELVLLWQGLGNRRITANMLKAFFGEFNQDILDAIDRINVQLPDGLIEGGIVQWKGEGYDYIVSSATVRENGVVYVIPTDEFTLSEADATLARKDTVVVSSNGFEVITGNPATEPIEPQPTGNQIRLTVIDILADSTAPVGVSTIDVYKENLEFTVTHSGAGTSNANNTNFPFQGAKSVLVSGVENNTRTIFTSPIDITISSLDSGSLRLRLIESFGSGHNLGVRLLNNSDEPVSNILTLNIQKGLAGAYQFVAFGISDFILTTDTGFRKIELVFLRSGNQVSRQGYYIDNFILQSGVTVTPPVKVSQHDDLDGIKGSGTYHVSESEWEAINGANSPSGSNVFATIADVVEGDGFKQVGDGLSVVNNKPTLGDAVTLFFTPQKGIENVGDYEANFTARSLVTRQFVDNIIKRYENLDVDSGSPVIIAVLPTTDHTGLFVDYTVKNGTNIRAGSITIASNGTDVIWNELSTADFGDTSGVNFSADISGGNIRLLVDTLTDNWVVKTLIRKI